MIILLRGLRLVIYFFISFQLSKVVASAVEEGWRYQDTFNICVTCGSSRESIPEGFLRSVHTPMAYTVDMAKEVYEKTDLPASSGRMFAVFRFTPVIQENPSSPIFLGNSISICNAAIDFPNHPLATGYECVFVSGFFKVSEDRTKLTHDIVKYDAHYGLTAETIKSEVFVRIPPLTFSPVSSTFIMRNYIDPGYFLSLLQFRYLGDISSSILAQGNYSQIREVHAETEKSLEGRKRKIEETLDTAKAFAGTTDISVLLKPLNKLESDRRKVGNNTKANSYSCAEQVGLDFISDVRVIEYLRRKTRIEDEKVIGVIVHLHTSETPCGGACATSLARECELGGLFNRIFLSKTVRLINTTSKHYRRPTEQIPYESTRYKEFLRPFRDEPLPIEFSLTSSNIPYPIILYGEDTPGNYAILRGEYSMRPI